MRAVDLHTHSVCSDGSLTPSELVHRAIKKNLSAIALTDHDTTDGVVEAMEAGKGYDIEIIPGVELSTEYHGKDIHIVGLYIDYTSPKFAAHLTDFLKSRDVRNEKMCARFREEGIPLTYEAIREMYPDCVITRSHYAGYLLEHGYVKSRNEAFDRYLGDHAKCYVPREKLSPEEGVNLILSAGGIPVLAHPILYKMSDANLEILVARLKDAGLIGIEAIYSTYQLADERLIRNMAKKYDLAISGGSDFHGDAKPGLDLGNGYGKLFVPEDVLSGLKEKAGK